MMRPALDIDGLLVGLRHFRSALCTCALAPQYVELLECRFTGKPRFNEITAYDDAGASDAGAAMHVDVASENQRGAYLRLNLLHVRDFIRHFGILDWAPAILGSCRQQVTILRPFVRLREIDEMVDTRLAQTLQASPSVRVIDAVGVFARQQAPGIYPVRIWERHLD